MSQLQEHMLIIQIVQVLRLGKREVMSSTLLTMMVQSAEPLYSLFLW